MGLWVQGSCLLLDKVCIHDPIYAIRFFFHPGIWILNRETKYQKKKLIHLVVLPWKACLLVLARKLKLLWFLSFWKFSHCLCKLPHPFNKFIFFVVCFVLLNQKGSWSHAIVEPLLSMAVCIQECNHQFLSSLQTYVILPIKRWKESHTSLNLIWSLTGLSMVQVALC